MEQQTAMQQLIKWMEERSQVIPFDQGDCYDKAIELLKVENQQLTMAQQSFKKGDRIDIGTGYQCDKGTFIRYEGNNVVWESDMGGEFKTPLSEYNINKSNKSTMEPKKILTEEQVRDMLNETKWKHNLTEEQIEYTIEDMNPIEVPSDEEINKQAIAVASYNELMSLQETCKSSGKYLGFTEGAKWMRNQILNKQL